MKAYQYEIISINEKERWIYLQADIWDEKDKQDMIWFFNRGSTSVEWGKRRVYRVNDSVD